MTNPAGSQVTWTPHGRVATAPMTAPFARYRACPRATHRAKVSRPWYAVLSRASALSIPAAARGQVKCVRRAGAHCCAAGVRVW